MYYKGKDDYKEKHQQYSQFESLEEYNKHMEMFLAVHKGSFTPLEFVVFRRLTKFCAKAFGVATISITKLLKAVKELDYPAGISESTFHRMKRRAKKLGILTWTERQEPFQRQTTNVWIFTKMLTSDIKSDTPKTASKTVKSPSIKGNEQGTALTPLKASNQSKTNKSNKRKARVQLKKMDGKEKKVRSNVPEAFRNILAPFLSNPAEIGEFWRMVQYYERKCPLDLEKDFLMRTAIGIFQKMMPKLKKRKVDKPIAYFSYTLQRCLAALVTEEQAHEERAFETARDDQDAGNIIARLVRKERENEFMLRVEEKMRRTNKSFESKNDPKLQEMIGYGTC